MAAALLAATTLLTATPLFFALALFAARVPVYRDLCPGRLAVRDHQVSPVRSDCVVIP